MAVNLANLMTLLGSTPTDTLPETEAPPTAAFSFSDVLLRAPQPALPKTVATAETGNELPPGGFALPLVTALSLATDKQVAPSVFAAHDSPTIAQTETPASPIGISPTVHAPTTLRAGPEFRPQSVRSALPEPIPAKPLERPAPGIVNTELPVIRERAAVHASHAIAEMPGQRVSENPAPVPSVAGVELPGSTRSVSASPPVNQAAPTMSGAATQATLLDTDALPPLQQQSTEALAAPPRAAEPLAPPVVSRELAGDRTGKLERAAVSLNLSSLTPDKPADPVTLVSSTAQSGKTPVTELAPAMPPPAVQERPLPTDRPEALRPELTPQPVTAESPMNKPSLEVSVERWVPAPTAPQPIAGSQPVVSPVAPATTPASSVPVSTLPAFDIEPQITSPQWGATVGNRVAMLIGQGTTAAELRVHPAELGPVQVQISVDDNVAKVAFGASQAMTREHLESMLPRLRELLAEQGIALGNASVSDRSGGNAFGQGGERDDRAVAIAEVVDPAAPEGTADPNRSRRPAGVVDTYA